MRGNKVPSTINELLNELPDCVITTGKDGLVVSTRALSNSGLPKVQITGSDLTDILSKLYLILGRTDTELVDKESLTPSKEAATPARGVCDGCVDKWVKAGGPGGWPSNCEHVTKPKGSENATSTNTTLLEDQELEGIFNDFVSDFTSGYEKAKSLGQNVEYHTFDHVSAAIEDIKKLLDKSYKQGLQEDSQQRSNVGSALVPFFVLNELVELSSQGQLDAVSGVRVADPKLMELASTVYEIAHWYASPDCRKNHLGWNPEMLLDNNTDLSPKKEIQHGK